MQSASLRMSFGPGVFVRLVPCGALESVGGDCGQGSAKGNKKDPGIDVLPGQIETFEGLP